MDEKEYAGALLFMLDREDQTEKKVSFYPITRIELLGAMADVEAVFVFEGDRWKAILWEGRHASSAL